MFSVMIGAAAIGLLLGLSLRVSAVVAASVAISVVGLSIAPFADVPALTAVLTIFGSLLALQCGYLAGLVVWSVWSRMRSSSLPMRQRSLDSRQWTEGRTSQAG